VGKSWPSGWRLGGFCGVGKLLHCGVLLGESTDNAPLWGSLVLANVKVLNRNPNVVGLPLNRLVALLARVGISVW
jgi:hypothetical protein